MDVVMLEKRGFSLFLCAWPAVVNMFTIFSASSGNDQEVTPLGLPRGFCRKTKQALTSSKYRYLVV